MALELSPQVFSILSVLIEERIGLHYGPEERELLSYKLAGPAEAAGFESLLDYYYHLRYDDPQGRALAALTDALVVNETYFFRERDALDRMIEVHVAPLCARGERPRIWSAASSTGEEPLTLAMLLAERGLLERTEIVATDISQRALEGARSGTYGRRSLREGHPPELAARYLEVSARGVQVAAALRGAVRFERVNLLDGAAVGALGRFELILCRNVLIYFRDDRAREVVARLAAALRPGGVLLVGVSESLMRFGTTLACEERGGTFFYRKQA